MLRHVRSGVHWVIYVDTDMPAATRSFLDSISGNQGEGQVIVRRLRFACELPEALASEVGTDGIISISRLDDDDAVSEDFFRPVLDEHMPCVVSQSWGYEVDLAMRIMRPIYSPLLSLNTTFIGPASMTAEYAQIGHHRIGIWANKNNIPVKEVQSDKGPSFIYSRHKQSDTSFGAKRKAIREDQETVVLTPATRSRFGFDEIAFQAWREFAQTAPSAPASKTWDKTTDLNAQVSRLLNEIAQLRRELTLATADIFHPNH
jgi:hypothetical protein